MRISNSYYLIVDLEATCSEDATVPRDEMEIIEIGAVMLSSRNFEVESEFQSFVHPVRHPQLTPFCTELTTITQRDVADAPPFHEAIKAMQGWMEAYDDALFCSWGDYDRKQFLQDCEYHHVAFPFRSGHLNLKEEFSRTLGRRKGAGIGQALRHLGLKFAGSPHRGLDDARNIARVVRQACMGIFALAVVALLVLAPAAFAGTVKQFPKSNFAVSLPEGWTEIDETNSKGDLAAGFCSADQTRMLLIFRDDRIPAPGELDDHFVTEYEQKIESTGGGKRLSGKFVRVQGIKSYERTGAGVWRGNSVSTLSRTIPAEDHFWLLRAMRWNGGIAEGDPAIREIMDSFRFLTPPASRIPADAESSPPSLPSPPPEVQVSSAPSTPVPAVKIVEEPHVSSTPLAPSVGSTSSAPPAGGEDHEKSFSKGKPDGNDPQPLLITLAIVGGSLVVIVAIIVIVARRSKKTAPGAVPPSAPLRKTSAPPPSPKAFAPATLAKTSAPSSTNPPASSPPAKASPPPPRPAKAPLAPFLSRAPAAAPVTKAAPPPPSPKPPTIPPPAKAPVVQTISETPAATPVAKVSAPPPPAKPPAPPPLPAPIATTALPEPPATPPAPPKESPPRPFVIRPRQRHMRE